MNQNDWKESLKRLGKRLKPFKFPLLVLLLGLVLLAIPTRSESSGQNEPETEEPVSQTQLSEEISLESLESRLSAILSQAEGAGRVQVMLQYAAGPKTVYQTDSSQEVATDAEGKETKVEVQTVLASQNGSGEIPVTVQTIAPTFQGALVIAEGADSSSVRLDLVNAVSSLTGLGADKITVIKMK